VSGAHTLRYEKVVTLRRRRPWVVAVLALREPAPSRAAQPINRNQSPGSFVPPAGARAECSRREHCYHVGFVAARQRCLHRRRWHAILGGLLLALFGILVDCQGSAESLFKDGIEAYQTGQFAGAAQAFRESTVAQPAAGTLVNLGVVEWRRGRTGPAILAWEQALWVDAFDQRAHDNLRFGRTMAGVDSPPLTWYEAASTWLPTNSWAWITGGGLWLALGMLLLPGICRWRRAGWQQVLVVLGLCVFLLSLPAQVGIATRSQLGFVLAKKTPLRLSPTAESETIVDLAAGEPLRRLRERGNYVFVQVHSSVGWVEREDIGLICPQ